MLRANGNTHYDRQYNWREAISYTCCYLGHILSAQHQVWDIRVSESVSFGT